MYEFPIFHLPVINTSLSFGHNNGTRDIGKLHFPKLVIRYSNLEIDSKFSGISFEMLFL